MLWWFCQHGLVCSTSGSSVLLPHSCLLVLLLWLCRSSAAEALLDGGAQVDAVDRSGRTALSYAAMYGSTDCIYLLANRGANVFHVGEWQLQQL